MNARSNVRTNEQGRTKAPPAMQNASQKSSGDKNKEVRGDKIYLFVLKENKRIKTSKQSNNLSINYE